MMWIAWPALWTMSIVLWWYAPPNSGVRWAALTACFGGCGALSVVVGDWIIPYVRMNDGQAQIIDLLIWGEVVTSAISQWGLPYAFLQFAFRFSGFCPQRWKRSLTAITFIPVIAMCWISPLHPQMQHAFVPLLVWAGPYLVVGIFLLLSSHWMESNYILRLNRRFTNLITIPLITFHFFSNYLMRAFQIEHVWYWNGLVVWIVFGVFIWLLIRRGVFGIRLHAEQQRHDWSWRAVQTSASTLHHALKGEINKLHWIAGRLKESSPDPESVTLNLLDQSVRQLEMVTNRMYRLTADFQLQEQWEDVQETLEEVCQSFAGCGNSHPIHMPDLRKNVVEWYVDSFHLREVLRNVIQNALDAMQGKEGCIRIGWHQQRSVFRLSIQDDGCGIPESHWRTIFQPYFSTKSNPSNYGFGLFYSYEVMQRHRGWLEVFSKNGMGTTMTLVFPRKRLRNRK